MDIEKLCLGAIAAVVLTIGGGPAKAESLVVGYSVWVGNGPLFVAQEKGFFADEGLDVKLVDIEGGTFDALYDDRVHALASTVDVAAKWFDPDHRPLCVLALDESRGGDGIVARTDIREIADLRGRTVAVNDGVSEFYLNVLLREAGLSMADIEPVTMMAPDAADMFMLGDVDAAVTWEPYLTDAATSESGHILADSSERPGLIVDCLFATASVFEQRKRDFQALARGWAAAVDYFEAQPAEAIEIMARNVGGWLGDPNVFASTLEKVRFYDRTRNQAYFGTPQAPGPIYDTAQKAIEVWSSLAEVEGDVTPADLIGHDIWDQ